jgi:hypothetical protein
MLKEMIRSLSERFPSHCHTASFNGYREVVTVLIAAWRNCSIVPPTTVSSDVLCVRSGASGHSTSKRFSLQSGTVTANRCDPD